MEIDEMIDKKRWHQYEKKSLHEQYAEIMKKEDASAYEEQARIICNELGVPNDAHAFLGMDGDGKHTLEIPYDEITVPANLESYMYEMTGNMVSIDLDSIVKESGCMGAGTSGASNARYSDKTQKSITNELIDRIDNDLGEYGFDAVGYNEPDRAYWFIDDEYSEELRERIDGAIIPIGVQYELKPYYSGKSILTIRKNQTEKGRIDYEYDGIYAIPKTDADRIYSVVGMDVSPRFADLSDEELGIFEEGYEPTIIASFDNLEDAKQWVMNNNDKTKRVVGIRESPKSNTGVGYGFGQMVWTRKSKVKKYYVATRLHDYDDWAYHVHVKSGDLKDYGVPMEDIAEATSYASVESAQRAIDRLKRTFSGQFAICDEAGNPLEKSKVGKGIDSILNGDDEFRYSMLSRWKSDLEYYFGNGNRNESQLWAGSFRSQIDNMQRVYDALEVKPDWLTQDMIEDYIKREADGIGKSKVDKFRLPDDYPDNSTGEYILHRSINSESMYPKHFETEAEMMECINSMEKVGWKGRIEGKDAYYWMDN